MLSILATYVLKNGSHLKSTNQGELIQGLKEIFDMLIYIIQHSRETYTLLYTILSLTAFIKALPELGLL
jgi:hypothetical protein